MAVAELLRTRAGRKRQSCLNILSGEVVFPTHIFEPHAAGDTSDDEGRWYSRTPDDGLAIEHCRIHNDTIVNIHANLTTGLACSP